MTIINLVDWAQIAAGLGAVGALVWSAYLFIVNRRNHIMTNTIMVLSWFDEGYIKNEVYQTIKGDINDIGDGVKDFLDYYDTMLSLKQSIRTDLMYQVVHDFKKLLDVEFVKDYILKHKDDLINVHSSIEKS